MCVIVYHHVKWMIVGKNVPGDASRLRFFCGHQRRLGGKERIVCFEEAHLYRNAERP